MPVSVSSSAAATHARPGRLVAAAAAVVLATLLAPPVRAADTPPAPIKWDLRDLYPTPETWNDAYDKVKARIGTLDRFKGTLGTSAESLLAAESAISDTLREGFRVFAYAFLLGDEDVRNAPNQERRQKARSLLPLLQEKTVWFAPEIQALGAAKIDAFIAASPELKRRFDLELRNTLRAAPHTLSLEGESLLAMSGDIFAQPNSIYQQLATGELPHPTLEIGGKKVVLDDPAYEKYRTSPDRAERKAVFDAFWGTFKSYQGTFGQTLATQVMGTVFQARARKHGNALQAALFEDNMPEAVYRQLVAQANAALPTLHRYFRLRKKLLGVTDDLAYYDVYPSIFKEPAGLSFTFDASKKITFDALAPLGDEYLGLMREGLAATWTDVYPRPGKATGAYVFGLAYDRHPYVLLNHNDDFESLSVLAHEWGHAVHTMLANRAQPFEKARYSTFIAESASIGNELLLHDYLVRTARNKEEKVYYLGHELELIRGTFFRQVMFAEFQLAMHEARERGEAISGASLTESYCALLRRYHGEAQGVMKIDPLYCNEWAFIPHFYYGFYVWQYATSLAGAAQITEDIQRSGAPARDRFVTLLKAGGSDYPYELYKRAGVDLAQAAPYQALVRRMERVMDEIEALQR